MRLLRSLLAAAVLCASVAAPALASPAPPQPPDPAVLDAARAKVAAGDTKGAIEGLAPYVAAHRTDLAAGRLLGDLYFRVPDFADAEKTWKAVLAVAPDDRETHNRLGSLYAAEDRVGDAIAEFQKSLPEQHAYSGLVMAHKKAGDLEPWLTGLQLDAESHRFDPARWSDLGRVRRAMRDYDRALEAFDHVVALRPNSCDARVDVANALVDLGRIDPAIDHLQKCVAREPDFYAAVVNLGEAYLEKRQIPKAVPYLDRALALRPNGTEALVDIGYVRDMQVDWKSAVTYYNRAILSDPLRPEAYINLGYDYNAQRLYPLAEAAFLKGISATAEDGRLHYLLAVTYNLQGKIALARAQYKDAVASGEPIVVQAAQREMALLPPS